MAIPQFSKNFTELDKINYTSKSITLYTTDFLANPNLVKILWGEDATLDPNWHQKQTFVVPEKHPAYLLLLLQFSHRVKSNILDTYSIWSPNSIVGTTRCIFNHKP